MAVMTQDEMKKLIQGGSIVDDSSMDILNRHLTGIAIASLGDDKEELTTVLKAYADELDNLVWYAEFFDLQHRWKAQDHIEWLRAR